MTKTKVWTIVILLLLSLCGEAYAYCIMSNSGCPQSGTGWPGATATFYSKGFSGSNSTFDNTFVEALNNWNNLSNFSYSSINTSAEPSNNYDGISGWKFDSTFYGSSFGTALAITNTFADSFSPSINNILDANIVFNTDYTWDVHNGFGNNIDFRRVATHELGHALGLDHEDDVPSIMSTNITHTIEVPQPDDINGLIALYGGSPLIIDTPSWFTASASDSTLSLSWNAVSGAEGYRLYYGYSSGNYADSLDLGNTTSTSFSGIPNGTYYLAITAYSGAVESDYSGEDSVTFNAIMNLTVPTGFTASASGSTLSLSWNAVSGAKGYYLYYGFSSGSYVDQINLGNNTGMSFSGIPDGTYYFAITAYAGPVESDYSGEDSVTFSTTVNLTAPTGFAASASGSTLSLSWNATSGAEGYYLYYGFSSGSYAGQVNLGNTTSQTYSVIPNGSYYLAVTAYAGTAESNYSNEANVTVDVVACTSNTLWACFDETSYQTPVQTDNPTDPFCKSWSSSGFTCSGTFYITVYPQVGSTPTQYTFSTSCSDAQVTTLNGIEINNLLQTLSSADLQNLFAYELEYGKIPIMLQTTFSGGGSGTVTVDAYCQ